MKETLIVCNHPETYKLLFHVLKLIREEDVMVLTVPFIAGMIHILTNSEDTALPLRDRTKKNSLSKRTITKTVETFLLKLDKHVVVPENPTQLAAEKVALEKRNVLIFPAGVVYSDLAKPEQWKSGVGRIAQEAYRLNPNINVAMMRIFGVTRAELTQSVRLENLGILPSGFSDEFTGSRTVAQNLARKYHDYFNVGDGSLD